MMSAECETTDAMSFIHHSALIIPHFLNPVHRIEEVFALRVDADAEALALFAEEVFQRRRRLLCARDVRDDDHRELPLYDRLVDVNDTATRLRQNLRHARDDPRMVNAEDGDDETVG